MEDFGDSLFTRSQWEAIHDRMGLSPRQQQMIEQLFRGHSDKQIATKLDIAISTVRAHLQRLYAKLNVHDRTEMVLLVMRVHFNHDTSHHRI